MENDLKAILLKDFTVQIEVFKKMAKERYGSWRQSDYYMSALDESLRLESLHVEGAASRRLLEVILESRMLSLELISAYQAGEFSGALLLGIGQEAVGAGVGLAAQSHDVIARDHRSVSAALARGTPLYSFWANHLMRSTSPTRGRDPNVHFADLARNDLGFLASDMGVGAALVNGACWYLNKKRALEKGSILFQEERSAGIAILGDGAASQGIVHEAMNFAKAFPLPVLFVILNNQIACRTSPKEQHGGIDLANRAIGYEMPMLTVDGDNVFAVYMASLILLDFARMTNHPCMLHAITFRRSGHNETERTDYVKKMFDQKFLEYWLSPEKDPLRQARRICEELELVSEGEFIDLREEVKARIDNAHKQAYEDPRPLADMNAGAFLDAPCGTVKALAYAHPPQGEKKEMTMKEAIRSAMREAFADDLALLMIGEDIGFPGGGVFELTAGLWDDVGRDRIKNVPLSEAAQGGFLAGAGLFGGRVILEYQFWNFFLAGANPILTLAATRPYLQGVSIPGVLRGPYGYAPQSNHYHETVPETYLLKSLGIKVVIPSSPFMAKGLFASAVRDPDLVAFLEEISSYDALGEVPVDAYYLPFEAVVLRPGKDITLATWGPKMVDLALASAAELIRGESPVDVEVIDLVVLNPWDKEKVFASLKKTGRLMILHEDSQFMGFGAEISAAVAEEFDCFYRLKARIMRMAAKNTPISAELTLEDVRLPQMEDILNTARRLMEESQDVKKVF